MTLLTAFQPMFKKQLLSNRTIYIQTIEKQKPKNIQKQSPILPYQAMNSFLLLSLVEKLIVLKRISSKSNLFEQKINSKNQGKQQITFLFDSKEESSFLVKNCYFGYQKLQTMRGNSHGKLPKLGNTLKQSNLTLRQTCAQKLSLISLMISLSFNIKQSSSDILQAQPSRQQYLQFYNDMKTSCRLQSKWTKRLDMLSNDGKLSSIAQSALLLLMSTFSLISFQIHSPSIINTTLADINQTHFLPLSRVFLFIDAESWQNEVLLLGLMISQISARGHLTAQNKRQE